jgi:two-component system, sensor histidine kinase and response regulator
LHYIIKNKVIGTNFGQLKRNKNSTTRIMRNDVTLNQNTPNILIVDDAPNNLQILGYILECEGYKIHKALSGLTALQLVDKIKPDLILLDIMMPGMNGFEVCSKIKENQKLNEIPIIIISALNDTSNIVRAFNDGAADYITKPFQAEEVKARVATHLKLYQQKNELQKLNAEKDKFFSIIAHDLKSPFNSIVGFSQLLVENVGNNDFDGIEKYAEIILNSSERAMELLTNLMEWSQAQTGRMEFNPEFIDILHFMNDITPIFENIAGQKSISIEMDLPASAIIFADKAMISTVMRNLITNAIKFTKPGGKIIISVTEAPNEVMISVTDSGIGIPRNRIDKLFHIYESYSTPGTQNEKGTGLGLVLCKEFIKKHGGNIHVKSEVGKGSVFSFTIPMPEV